MDEREKIWRTEEPKIFTPVTIILILAVFCVVGLWAYWQFKKTSAAHPNPQVATAPVKVEPGKEPAPAPELPPAVEPPYAPTQETPAPPARGEADTAPAQPPPRPPVETALPTPPAPPAPPPEPQTEFLSPKELIVLIGCLTVFVFVVYGVYRQHNPIIIKRRRPLIPLGWLGLVFLFAAAIILFSGFNVAEDIRAKAIKERYKEKKDMLERITYDKEYALEYDRKEGKKVLYDEDEFRLRLERAATMYMGVWDTEETKAKNSETPYQIWAAILGILGLILSTLGFSYSQPEP